MGEKSVLAVQAHVFQIDPDTKKKWLPTSTSSVKVAYYHDPSRKTYRIIAIEDRKPLINSTVTANMTFTKTSPKFGQWSDHRANTVYGLGFSSEKDLSSFSDKFSEAKTAARILLEERKKTKTATTTSITTADSNRSQPSSEGGVDKEDTGDLASPNSPSSSSLSSTSPPIATTTVTTTPSVASTTPSKPSTNGNASTEESDKQVIQQVESLKFENSKLKVALASSAQNVKKWDSEMQTLRNNNAMLTTALEESTQHVAEWKRQLQKYKEECDTLRKKVSESEGSGLSAVEVSSLKEENDELKEVLSAVQVDLEQKTEECSKKDILLSEMNEKILAGNSEREGLLAKLKQAEAKMKLQEDSVKEKHGFLHQKHKEIESQLASLLSLQKELSKQFST